MCHAIPQNCIVGSRMLVPIRVSLCDIVESDSLVLERPHWEAPSIGVLHGSFTFVHFFCTVCCRLLYSDPKSSSSSIERYVSGTVASIGACLILLLLRYGTFSCLA